MCTLCLMYLPGGLIFAERRYTNSYFCVYVRGDVSVCSMEHKQVLKVCLSSVRLPRILQQLIWSYRVSLSPESCNCPPHMDLSKSIVM